ncbi:MAG: ArsR family transcriptional regulator [Proteobacteria bacterium]|nr:ArsR family transcriptional regulator [Pseudomonadota bacterium]MBU1545094.1 ArsR family transcriptional regulator [Pseudomonadota bacterium]
MLEALITSKTKLKLLLKFFLNTSSTGYLRGLAVEFNESTNAVRLELNKLEEAGLLESQTEGPRKVFRANARHPLFPDIQSIVRKYIGMDEIIESVINHLGNPREVYLMGELAKGLDSDQINLLIVGDSIDIDYFNQLILKAQKIISRKIGYLILTPIEYQQQLPKLKTENLLLVWENEEVDK